MNLNQNSILTHPRPIPDVRLGAYANLTVAPGQIPSQDVGREQDGGYAGLWTKTAAVLGRQIIRLHPGRFPG